MSRSRASSRRAFATTLFLLFMPISIPSSHSTESVITETCGSELAKFEAQLIIYQGSEKKTGLLYRELRELHKGALRERMECIKEINRMFKLEIETIKSNFDSAKDEAKSRREVRATQKRAEISAAIVKRDDAIKKLGVVPELPARPLRTK